MGLLGEFDSAIVSPGVPPPVLVPRAGPSRDDPDARRRLAVAEFLVRALLVDAASLRSLVPRLEASVAEDVVVWTPSMHTTSRTGLVTALLDSDDAITDVDVSIVGGGVAGSSAYVEWRATGRFHNPAFLHDDLLVEPSGRVVESAGMAVVELTDGRATLVHCLYDLFGLFDQILPGGIAARLRAEPR